MSELTGQEPSSEGATVKQGDINLLQLKPERQFGWEINPETEDTVTILVPKFRGKFLGKWLQPKLKRPYFRVKLDAYGTLVWQSCDGQNSVYDIGQKLRKRFTENVEPLYERLGDFMRQLERNQLIAYNNIKEIEAQRLQPESAQI